ncbi:MAG TPA: alpha/beta hydrolase [Clostridia bacterium]|nr:alpha/beta hydrolase [Clostridia bacterium]
MKTVFMIHGMFGGSWYWGNFKDYFERQGYNCVIPTLRYHDVPPDSAPDPRLGTTGLLDYAADLEREIKKLKEPPIVMGHSMGGLLSQILGSRGLAKALVLLTPAAPAGILPMKFSVMRSFAEVAVRPGFWSKPFRLSPKTVAYSITNLKTPSEQQAIYSKLVHESGRALFQLGLWFFDSTKSSAVDQEKVKCPVLVISGKEDRIVPASVVKQVAEKYGDLADYREYENHAHWLIDEQGWEDIAHDIDGWLQNKL